MGYATDVARIHRSFSARLKKAGSAKSARAALAAHKKAHTRLLKRHLAEEERDVRKKIKSLK